MLIAVGWNPAGVIPSGLLLQGHVPQDADAIFFQLLRGKDRQLRIPVSTIAQLQNGVGDVLVPVVSVIQIGARDPNFGMRQIS